MEGELLELYMEELSLAAAAQETPRCILGGVHINGRQNEMAKLQDRKHQTIFK